MAETVLAHLMAWPDTAQVEEATLRAALREAAIPTMSHALGSPSLAKNALTNTAATCGTIAFPAPRNNPTLPVIPVASGCTPS